MKLSQTLITYKHKQVKKGYVKTHYLKSIYELEKNNVNNITVREIMKTLPRDRTRIADVLKMLHENGLVEKKQLRRTGRPFSYSLSSKGRNFLNSLI